MTEQERKRIDAEIHLFVLDKRHLDYEETDRNADLKTEWLDREGLEISAESLHSAYVALHDELDVLPRYAKPRAPAAPIPPPPAPQAPAQEPEPRLHAVERRPGESSWMAAQRAYAEQQISAQRKARQQMRAACTSAQRRQSRELNNLFAAARKPRGRGVGHIIENGE